MKTEDEVIEVNYTILLLYINLKQQKHGNKRNYLQLCQSDHFW